MVYNSVKLSEPQISLKKHATSCRMQRTNRNKTLKSVVDTPLHTLKLIDWWLKKRLTGSKLVVLNLHDVKKIHLIQGKVRY